MDYNSTLYLSQVNYSCDPGHELMGGNVTRVCLLSGMWSGEDPVCQSEYACVNIIITSVHILT